MPIYDQDTPWLFRGHNFTYKKLKYRIQFGMDVWPIFEVSWYHRLKQHSRQHIVFFLLSGMCLYF